MMIDWGDYEIYDPCVDRPLSEVSRKESRAAFDKLMQERDERVEQLRRLLARNGVELDSSDEGIQALNDWFRDNVEEDLDSPGRLLPDWYSVVNDIGLFLGEVMIERSPHLEWIMFTGGKKDIAFQRNVIMGFRNVENPKYNRDPDMIVAQYGHRLVAGSREDDDLFVRLVRGSELEA